MICRRIEFWFLLLVFLMLSITEESAYAATAGVDCGSLLPSSFVKILEYFRWTFLIMLVLDGFTSVFSIKKLSQYQSRFVLFYLILAVLSVFYGDMIRYFGLLAMVVVVPIAFTVLLEKYGLATVLKTFYYFVIFLTFVGLFATFRSVGFSIRYTGWLRNPNAFILINTFFILIVMANLLYKNIRTSYGYFFLSFLVYGQLSAGSRAGFISLCILSVAFMLLNRMSPSKLILILIVFLLGFFFFLKCGPEDSLRVFQLSSAFSDSGRADTLLRIMPEIQKNWLFGCGFYAMDECGVAVFSSYVLLVFFIGIPGGTFLSAWYIYSCYRAIIRRKDFLSPVRDIMVAYMLTLPFMMLGENIITGIGMPWFFQILLGIGFISALSRPDCERFV